MKTATINMEPSDVEDIRRAKTSDLIRMLNIDFAAEVIASKIRAEGASAIDGYSCERFMKEIADEIDRRIPVARPGTPSDEVLDTELNVIIDSICQGQDLAEPRRSALHAAAKCAVLELRTRVSAKSKEL